MEVLPNAAAKGGCCMLQRKLIYFLILLLVISSWIVGFYFGRKSETDKKLSYSFSLSHTETLIDSIELVKNSRNQQASVLLIEALDSSLFPVFYELSKDSNSLNNAEMSRVSKVINKVGEVLSREDTDYLVPIVTDDQSKKEYYSYIQKGLAEIRNFDTEEKGSL